MALKSYVLTQNFKTPFVQMTGRPDRPQLVRFKSFKKGDVVNGELKHANNQPAFVLVQGVLVFPLSVVKELVTKDVVNADGGSSKEKSVTVQKIVAKASKVKYVDAVVVGGLLGAGAMLLAEKKGWVVSPDYKNKAYAAIGGALLGVYLIYRTKNK